MEALPISSHKLLLLVVSLFHFCSSTVWANPHTARSKSVPHRELGRVFEYVIVGVGPGGLVMANRLTEDPSVSVAIVEAGTWPEDVVGNLTEVPAYDFYFDSKAANATYPGVDWGFLTTPQPVSLHDSLLFAFR
jgi:choline dehydrogenase